MKNGHLQTSELANLRELYDAEEYEHKKGPLRERILMITENLSARDRAAAEADKLKAQTEEIYTADIKSQRARVWAPVVMASVIAISVTVCVVMSIAGVTFINGYWEYWSQR